MEEIIDNSLPNLYLISLGDLISNDNDNRFESNIIYDNKNIDENNLNNLNGSNSSNRLTLSCKFRFCEKNDNYIIVEFLSDCNEQYEFIYDLDNCVIDYIFKNSEKIFGTKTNLDTIENMLMRSLYLPVAINKLPTMKIELSDNIKIYDINGEECNTDILRINQEITFDLIIDKVFFYNNGFKMHFYTDSINISKHFCQCNDYLFLENEDNYNID